MIPINTRASLPNVPATVVATQNDTTAYQASRFSALSAGLIRRAREPYEDWYLSNPRGRWTNPAKNAYESALEILKKELTLDEYQSIWLSGHASMEDVQYALSTALEEYQKKSNGSKVRKWLSNCSSRVTYYGTVFDVFVQHHPEYVSLVWGTFKFLFIAVMNHEELLIEISKAVSRIADVLPRTELHSTLYPTDRMQEAVSMVYAKIIEFSLKAVKWYKKNKLMHSISSIINPFSLAFKDIIDEISERSRKVDELASAAAKAEIRDLHINIHGLNERICQLTEMMVAHQTLQDEIMVDLREQKQFFRNSQIEEIGKTLLLEDTPIPDEALECCRSLRNRRRQKTPIQLPFQELLKFKHFLSSPSSSLLLAQGQGVKTSSMDFAVDLLDAILEQGHPVLWALESFHRENEPRPSITGILRSLVSQAINLNPSAVSEGVNPIRKHQLKNMVGVDPWFQVLERCLLNIPHLFMVIELGSIEMALASADDIGESFKVSDFVERISELVYKRSRGGLKIIIASWQFQSATSLEAFDIFGAEQIYTDAGKRVERLMRQPKYRATYKRRNARIVEKLKSTMEVIHS